MIRPETVFRLKALQSAWFKRLSSGVFVAGIFLETLSAPPAVTLNCAKIKVMPADDAAVDTSGAGRTEDEFFAATGTGTPPEQTQTWGEGTENESQCQTQGRQG